MSKRGYTGNYWAIVLGVKGLKPKPLLQFVRTANKRRLLTEYRHKHPNMTIRAIPQPNPPYFEMGM